MTITQLWVNPRDGQRMVLSSDQGTVVSVDGGKTWSTWYNQPTAQIYHVAAGQSVSLLALRGAAGQRSGAGEHVVEGRRSEFPQLEPICLAG